MSEQKENQMSEQEKRDVRTDEANVILQMIVGLRRELESRSLVEVNSAYQVLKKLSNQIEDRNKIRSGQ